MRQKNTGRGKWPTKANKTNNKRKESMLEESLTGGIRAGQVKEGVRGPFYGRPQKGTRGGRGRSRCLYSPRPLQVAGSPALGRELVKLPPLDRDRCWRAVSAPRCRPRRVWFYFPSIILPRTSCLCSINVSGGMHLAPTLPQNNLES